VEKAGWARRESDPDLAHTNGPALLEKRSVSIARAEKCCTESAIVHPFIWIGLLVREQEGDR
jgi:hypothetical protein